MRMYIRYTGITSRFAVQVIQQAFQEAWSEKIQDYEIRYERAAHALTISLPANDTHALNYATRLTAKLGVMPRECFYAHTPDAQPNQFADNLSDIQRWLRSATTTTAVDISAYIERMLESTRAGE